MTLLLQDKEVRAALDMGELVRALERAMVAERHEGKMLMPARTNLNFDAGFLRVMPVVMPATGVLGLKMFYGGRETGVRYVVMVSSISDGEVLVVVDGAYLTAARTGAISGLATDHMARPGPARIGVIGSGLEAETNLLGVLAVRDARDVRVFSRSDAKRTAFVERMSDRVGAPITATATPEEAVVGADIVVVATNTGATGEVAYKGAWAEPGQHIVSIGSTTPTLRESDENAFLRAAIVVFDADPEQVEEESGDVIALLNRSPGWDASRSLAAVVCGEQPGRTADNQITMFKSVGTASQDMIGALYMHETATRRGLGTSVADLALPKLF